MVACYKKWKRGIIHVLFNTCEGSPTNSEENEIDTICADICWKIGEIILIINYFKRAKDAPFYNLTPLNNIYLKNGSN